MLVNICKYRSANEAKHKHINGIPNVLLNKNAWLPNFFAIAKIQRYLSKLRFHPKIQKAFAGVGPRRFHSNYVFIQKYKKRFSEGYSLQIELLYFVYVAAPFFYRSCGKTLTCIFVGCLTLSSASG